MEMSSTLYRQRPDIYLETALEEQAEDHPTAVGEEREDHGTSLEKQAEEHPTQTVGVEPEEDKPALASNIDHAESDSDHDSEYYSASDTGHGSDSRYESDPDPVPRFPGAYTSGGVVVAEEEAGAKEEFPWVYREEAEEGSEARYELPCRYCEEAEAAGGSYFCRYCASSDEEGLDEEMIVSQEVGIMESA